ncbi:hypothetical protein R3P38DRAFT_2756942 [Favolaschia claudopus]|uniref:Hyaluronan/mRNA-binding protein domain-containing protein n=1 Tax=Favolaschia claudopus TaxID=2862362 RepID=A0AAW0EFA7_9AGAR
MSVATKNPFALLEEDASRPNSPVSAPAPAVPTPPAPARGNANKSRGGPAARGGKYYARGGGAKSGARADDLGGNPNQNGIEEAPQEKKFDGRGRGRGGGGRGGGGFRGRGRQFDKHSQTGKVDSQKSINQGWGAEEGTAELKAEETAVKDATAEAAGGEWAAPSGDANEWGAPAASNDWAASADGAAPAADGAEAGAKPEREGRPRREREPEEEDNTLTFDQYLAQQKESSAVPKLENVRQANEGADANIWKDAVAIEKDSEGSYFAGKAKAAPKARAKKEEKVFLEIDARFERPARGGGRGRGGDDRGGRGRGGGERRGRGAPRGGGRSAGNNNSQPLDVADESAFPSLS